MSFQYNRLAVFHTESGRAGVLIVGVRNDSKRLFLPEVPLNTMILLSTSQTNRSVHGSFAPLNRLSNEVFALSHNGQDQTCRGNDDSFFGWTDELLRPQRGRRR